MGYGKTRLEKALANKGVTRGMTIKRNGIDVTVDDEFFKKKQRYCKK